MMLRRLIENETKKSTPLWFLISWTFAYVIILNILITECNNLPEEVRPHTTLILLGIFTAFYILIMMSGMTAYVYKLIEDEFIVEKQIGRKAKILLKIDLDDIIEMKSYEEAKAEGSVLYTYKFVSDREYKKAYLCTYKQDNKNFTFLFKPSDRLRDILTNKVYSNGRYRGV